MYDQWEYVAVVYIAVFATIIWWFWMIASKLRKQRAKLDAATTAPDSGRPS